jgi:hydroxymethylpyrimidine pyrophosphatase-like HAD family hydrolase
MNAAAPVLWFRAVAVDYDGTLCSAARPGDEALGAVAEARQAGVRVVLVTGRILEELAADFPEVEQHFDAIVAENGAVLVLRGSARSLAAPVAPALGEALLRAGVPLRRGQVLLATQAAHAAVILEHSRALGLDCHLVHNRSELMVLPPEVSKGTGVVAALSALGLSAHDCVGIGDAENDHALLDACEVGIAVGDAVPALKLHADLVLAEPDGAGVARFLRGQIAGQGPPLVPRRWQIELGTFGDGTPARIPASQLRVLIRGGSGSGKSFLAGLLCERLLELGYTLCALDPEGDHGQLGERPGVVTVGGGQPLVPVEHVVRLLGRQMGSVVVDLSLEPPEVRARYSRTLLAALLELRRQTGLPHWIVVDEAHVPLGAELEAGCLQLPAGLCLVTWRPEWLCSEACSGHDVVLEALHPDTVELRQPGQPPRTFRPGTRESPHQRHWHKYVDGAVPKAHRFWFRTPGGRNGRSAGNLKEFDLELRDASDAVIRHHARHGDFSRWIVQVFRDHELSGALAQAEAQLQRDGDAARARSELRAALERRYPAATPA